MYNNGFDVQLTDKTLEILNIFFQGDKKIIVTNILKNKCGNNLPLCENFTPNQLERIRLAIIKLSEGQLERFNTAVELSNTDWRDLLFAADFDEANSHKVTGSVQKITYFIIRNETEKSIGQKNQCFLPSIYSID